MLHNYHPHLGSKEGRAEGVNENLVSRKRDGTESTWNLDPGPNVAAFIAPPANPSMAADHELLSIRVGKALDQATCAGTSAFLAHRLPSLLG